MIDLAARLRDLPAVRGRAPWPGHEDVKGWGVFGLPFDSGHVLALRVLPGNAGLFGTMPSGHVGTLMPQRMYLVEESRAVLAGADLGRPTHAAENPRIGDVALPARGVLAIGQGAWVIRDQEEYERTRAETAHARGA